MNKLNRQAMFELKKLPAILQKQILEKLPSKDLFCLLNPDKKSFGVVSKIILHRKEAEDKETPLYQEKLLRIFSQMENAEVRNRLLEIKEGSHALIDIIKEFANEAEGKAVMSAWVLLAQYANKTLVMDEALIQSLTNIGILHVFSPFLTPLQRNAHLVQKPRFPEVIEKKESAALPSGLVEAPGFLKATSKKVSTPVFSDDAVASRVLDDIAFIINNYVAGRDVALKQLEQILLNKKMNTFISDKWREIFDLIIKVLEDGSLKSIEAGISNLNAFIMQFDFSLEKSDRILKLIEKSFSSLLQLQGENLSEIKKLLSGGFAFFVEKAPLSVFLNNIECISKITKMILTNSLDLSDDLQVKLLFVFTKQYFSKSKVSVEEKKSFFDFFKLEDVLSSIKESLDNLVFAPYGLGVLAVFAKQKVPFESDLWEKGLTAAWENLENSNSLDSEEVFNDDRPCFLNAFATLTKHCPLEIIENKEPTAEMAKIQKVICFLHSVVLSNVIEKKVKETPVQTTPSIRP